jgi:drug/metabolite transporter (DMT)-like permease
MNRIAYLLLLMPPLLWSGNFVVGRAYAEQISPITLSFWRWVLAAIILLPFVIKSVWNHRQLIKNNFVSLLVLSATGVSAFNTLAYIGLQSTTATNGTLLNSFIPIFIILLSQLFFQTKTNKQQLLGILISFCGVLIILIEFKLENLLTFSLNQGDLWILVAGLDWALYSILLKQYRPAQLDNLTFLGITVILGSLLLLPLYLWNPFNEVNLDISFEVVNVLIFVAVFPSILAFFAWNYGIDKVGANIGGQFIHLMPLYGALLAMIFLGESLYLYHLVGGVFIAIGLLLSLNVWDILKKNRKTLPGTINE